jgi:hypothetical protein
VFLTQLVSSTCMRRSQASRTNEKAERKELLLDTSTVPYLVTRNQAPKVCSTPGRTVTSYYILLIYKLHYFASICEVQRSGVVPGISAVREQGIPALSATSYISRHHPSNLSQQRCTPRSTSSTHRLISVVYIPMDHSLCHELNLSNPSLHGLSPHRHTTNSPCGSADRSLPRH